MPIYQSEQKYECEEMIMSITAFYKNGHLSFLLVASY